MIFIYALPLPAGFTVVSMHHTDRAPEKFGLFFGFSFHVRAAFPKVSVIDKHPTKYLLEIYSARFVPIPGKHPCICWFQFSYPLAVVVLVKGNLLTNSGHLPMLGDATTGLALNLLKGYA